MFIKKLLSEKGYCQEEEKDSQAGKNYWVFILPGRMGCGPLTF